MKTLTLIFLIIATSFCYGQIQDTVKVNLTDWQRGQIEEFEKAKARIDDLKKAIEDQNVLLLKAICDFNGVNAESVKTYYRDNKKIVFITEKKK